MYGKIIESKEEVMLDEMNNLISYGIILRVTVISSNE